MTIAIIIIALSFTETHMSVLCVASSFQSFNVILFTRRRQKIIEFVCTLMLIFFTTHVIKSPHDGNKN